MTDPLLVDDRHVVPGDEIALAYSRSGGPGGQHVNTTDTRVRLTFALATSAALDDATKARLAAANPAWMKADGDLQLTCDRYRSRKRNIDEARSRLAAAIRTALVPPRRRRPTKPSRSAIRRRLTAKKQRGSLKASRGRVSDD